MAGVIVPVAKPLCLCDGATISAAGNVNVIGVYTRIRAPVFPCVRRLLTIFVQLGQGLGDVKSFVDIRRMVDDRLVYTSSIHTVSFQNRAQTRYLVITMPNVPFDRPGMYLVELLCENTWVADVTLELVGRMP